MRLEMDLVRELLLEVEKAPANMYPEVELPNRDENEVLEHLELLIEANLLEGVRHESGMGEDGRLLAVDITRLTWDGHQFLADARNEQVWARTKAIVTEKGGAASFAVVKGLLIATALHFFGLTP